MARSAPGTTDSTLTGIGMKFGATIGLGAGYLLFGSVAGALIQWFVLLIIARSHGAVGAGEYSLVQSYIIPTSYLVWLSLRQIVLTDVEHKYDANDFLALRIAVPLLGWILLSVVFVASTGAIHLIWLFIAVSALKFVEGFFDLAFGFFQAAKKNIHIGTASLLRLVVSLPSFAFTLAWTSSVPLSLGSVGLAWILIFLFVEWRKVVPLCAPKRPLFLIERSDLTRRWLLLVSAFPLGLSGMVMALNGSISRIIMSQFSSISEIGYLAVAAQFLTIAGLIVTSVGQSILPHLAGYVRNRAAGSFWRTILWIQGGIAAACFIAIPIAWFFGDEVVRIMFGPGFANISPVLVAGACAGIPAMTSSILAYGMTAVGLYSAIMRFYVIVLIVNVLLSIVFVPLWGSVGAFVAGGGSSLVLQVLSFFAIRTYWRERKQVRFAGRQP